MVRRELLIVSVGREIAFFFKINLTQPWTTSEGSFHERLFRLCRTVDISVGIVLIMPTEMGRPAPFGWNYSLGRRFETI